MKNKNFDESFILNKAIIRCEIPLFKYSDAVDFINLCSENEKTVIGIDAFNMGENYIQPTMEHSIDFSSDYKNFKQNTTDNKHALNFLKSKKELNLVFEIIYE